MQESDPFDSLVKRVKKAFNPEPKPEPITEEKRKATEKAIGPRFRNTVKKAEPAPLEPPKRPKRTAKRARKGPSKY